MFMNMKLTACTEQIQETCIPYFLCRVMSSVGGWLFFDHTYLLLLLSYYYENTIMTSIYYIILLKSFFVLTFRRVVNTISSYRF